ncbi:hypothetical protein EDD15DRAFT_2378512 [Pisolithus albus]|nr:hypothetical protein EDD15DRAFT_2378512 [Pisolithus albus]
MKEEGVLETDGVNLKVVTCVLGVDFTLTYPNSCIEIFEILGIAAMCTAIMKELRGVTDSDGPYTNDSPPTITPPENPLSISDEGPDDSDEPSDEYEPETLHAAGVLPPAEATSPTYSSKLPLPVVFTSMYD